MSSQLTPKISQLLCTFFMCLAFLGFGQAYAAIAPAGAEIKNVAEADYSHTVPDHPDQVVVDPNTKLPIIYNSKSNDNVPVITIVKPVYIAQFIPDNALLALPNELVAFPHKLTNVGNIADTYTLSAVDLGGDDGVLNDMVLVYDKNHDGKFNIADGDSIITNTTPITLNSGQSADILLLAKIPQAVTFGNHFDAQVSVANNRVDPLNPDDTVNITRADKVTVLGPNLQLTKTVDKNTVDISSNVANANILFYTLTFTNKNEGTATAAAAPLTVSINGKSEERVVFEDPLPANLIFRGITYSGVGELLYRKPTDGEKVYTKYDPVNPPNNADVAAIAIAFPDFAVGRSDQATLKAQVLNTGYGATIINQFQALYHYGVDDKLSISTEVKTTVQGTASIKPKDQYYNLVGQISLSKDLFLEANCAQCNVRPTVRDRLRLKVTSKRSGDEEIVNAIETDINSGVFRIYDLNLSSEKHDALPTRDMFQFPATSGNYIIETTKHDVLTATILYCLDDDLTERPNSKVNVTANILVDPFGVVFDSITNMPIANATVKLVLADGSPAVVFDDAQKRCTPPRDPQADPACPENATITTGPTGEYRFPFVPVAKYKLIITAPAGYSYPSVVPITDLAPFHREVKLDGSYGFAFDVTPEGPIEIDVPMDPPLVFSSTLFVKKTTTRKTVEVGDFIDYQIVVRNASPTNTDAKDVLLVDHLPQGFSYVLGSARVDKVANEPAGGRGPTLTFKLGDLKTGKEITITYRAQVGVGALRGDGVNRARAQENIVGGIYSAEAAVPVTVLAGVFTSEAYVTGKVYTDCNRSGIQDNEEIGVPGVRLMMEDGSFVITDVEGKFNFYGLRPKTHVLKLDRTTLPDDVELIEQSVRNAGDPASRFVDLKAGELHRADFAITTDNATCSGPAMTEIYSRRNQGDHAIGELERALKADLTFDTTNPSDVRSLPASGCVVSTGNDCGVHGKAKLPTLSSAAVKGDAEDIIRVAPPAMNSGLESYLADGASNQLAVLNLKDQQVLAFAQTDILVKGTAGARFELKLNGEDVSDHNLGTKIVLADRQLEAREYIGVNLVPGENRIALKQYDSMGNARGTSVLVVTAPDNLFVLKIAADQKEMEADGNNETLIHVKLLDKHDVPVTSRTQITLESNMGRFRAIDLDPVAPGIQLFVEGGEFAVKFVAPTEAGDALIRVKSGLLTAETNVRFVPELRPMVAAGIVEGMVSFKHFDTNKVSAANAQDGFEDELSSLASSNNGQLNVGGRAALFLKGKVKGEYLLTLSYDSDKDNKQRLFRDIRPEDYYPVYGDSAVKGFDAQSTSKLYVRLDKGRSYAMFGDYTTRIDGSDALSLGQYSRSLTGVRGHYETDNVRATVFAAQTKSKQVVVEVPAQGISGPYQLPGIDGLLVNSEKVEVILRDRNNPGLILSATPQARFVDYDFEPLSSSLYFKSAVPSLDANLNPFSIRVTVEVQDNAGPDYWVGGAQAETNLSNNISVGAAVVEEDVPDDSYRLSSANTTVKLGDYTKLIAEVAQSDRETKDVGNASRVEINHNKGTTNLRLYYGISDAAFDNPAAPLSAGRSESGYKLQFNLEQWIVRSEASRSEDTTIGGVRQGAKASVERSFNKYISMELGARYYNETSLAASSSSLGVTPYDGVTARGKLNLQIPKVEGASAYTEYEQDIENPDRKLMAVGGDYRLGTQGKLYARHEFISSLSGNFGLNDQQERNSTVVGVESDYMKDGRVFSEYRVRDAVAAKDVEAAIGLRNRWYLSKDVRASTNLERVTTLEGPDSTDATAVSLGLEYLANPLWKATGKIDLRWADQADTILNTLGIAYKLSRDWTLLTRNTVNFTDNHKAGNRLQDRFQLGAAYRQVDTNQWDTLTKIEYKLEKDESIADVIDRNAYIFSTHVNYHPVRRLTLAGEYAGKWVVDKGMGLDESTSATHMIGLRAIRDLTERWEASVQGGWMAGDTGGKRYVLGAETGYLVTTNLWLSVGYNWQSYSDADVVGSDFTVDGAYLRMRFKFDEDLFNADKPKTNKTLEAQHVSP